MPTLALRTLDAVPVEGEIELSDLLRVAALKLSEAIPALADLVVTRHVVTRQEMRGGRMVRLYRRALPIERLAPVTVEYDLEIQARSRDSAASGFTI